eukprot:6472896-Amphidinium_carterae.3
MVPGVASPPADRRFAVKRQNIEQLGAYPGCPASVQIIKKVKVTMAHTEACRERVKAAVKREGPLKENFGRISRLDYYETKRCAMEPCKDLKETQTQSWETLCLA